MIRIGIGYDVHRLVTGRPCILGGEAIASERGLEGHSDADVLLHAICDALLGAAGMGDLGRYFPSNDPTLAGISSLKILEKVVEILTGKGYRIVNIDSVIVAERPLIAPHAEKMCRNIAGVARIDRDAVNVKATTNEKIGFIGRGEGVAAQAVCTLSLDIPQPGPDSRSGFRGSDGGASDREPAGDPGDARRRR